MESRRRGAGEGKRRVVEKPEGGFRLVPVRDLCAVWSAYQLDLVSACDLEVWFAAQVAVSRRCQLESGREASYRVEELAKLVARDARVITRSLGRLTRAGLLSWSKQRVSFGANLKPEVEEALEVMLAAVGHNPKRPVPIPRRTLELLAEGQARVMTATILGHLLRCVFFSSGRVRERGYTFEGRVKAAWVSDVFGVSLRGVKGARKKLLQQGWLVRGESGQWALNRWGSRVAVNPIWNVRPAAVQATSHAISAPPPTEIAPVSAPLRENQNPLREVYNNQKPAVGRPAGPFQAKPEKSPPTLRDVKRSDLTDVARLRTLFLEATTRKWVRGSDAEFLDFVAAAERARRLGEKNPPGFFVRLVRDRLVGFIGSVDEDAAWRRIKAHEDGRESTEHAKHPETTRRSVAHSGKEGTDGEGERFVGRGEFAALFASLMARTKAA